MSDLLEVWGWLSSEGRVISQVSPFSGADFVLLQAHVGRGFLIIAICTANPKSKRRIHSVIQVLGTDYNVIAKSTHVIRCTRRCEHAAHAEAEGRSKGGREVSPPHQYYYYWFYLGTSLALA